MDNRSSEDGRSVLTFDKRECYIVKEYLERERYNEKYNWLVMSKSPYLKQHETNPVNWLEWSPEAFQKAKREGKPVFLSIGYS